MKQIFNTKNANYLLAFLFLGLSYGCQPDDEDLQDATFPNIAEVFIDTFSAGLEYDAFGTSKVTAFDVDTNIVFEGSASMRFDIPNTNDPEGGFAGGVFTTSVGRDLTDYNVLSFYARASKGETINQVGFGLTFQGEVFRTQLDGVQVGTEWQKYFIPIPNGAKLTQERGMFWYAEAADDGISYQLWIDEVQFENVNTVLQVDAGILEGQDVFFPANQGTSTVIGGAFVNHNLPNGLLQRVNAAPAYFDFTSSNESVATVSEEGVVSVINSGGQTTISATLAGEDVAGSLNVGMSDLPPSPNVDDSGATSVSLPLGFESNTLTYDFLGFEGAASAIEANPDQSGINPTATVMRTTKTNGAQFFAGTLINLDAPIDFSTSEILSIKSLSPKANIPVRLAIENQTLGGGSQLFIDTNTSTADTWEELLFNFGGQIDPSISYDRIIIFFEFIPELLGDGSVYFFDDVFVIGSDPINGGSTGGGSDDVEIPVDFELDPSSYDLLGFEGADSAIESNPDPSGINASPNVLRSLKTAGAQFFAGTFLNLDNAIDFSGSQVLSVDTYSPKANIPVRLALENQMTGDQIFIDTNTTTINSWETLEFDFSGVTNPSIQYDRIVIFFEFIEDLPGDGSTYFADNIQLSSGGGGGNNLLANGDFESGMVDWFGNAFNVVEDGGNSFNFANVMTAGNAFDVNLSQVVEIIPAASYTLTFDASSDGNRTIIAGIGLNESPFIADVETINLTTDTQTFTLNITASFGIPNSRVLFDLGAETGVVVIDNVSLVQN